MKASALVKILEKLGDMEVGIIDPFNDNMVDIDVVEYQNCVAIKQMDDEPLFNVDEIFVKYEKALALRLIKTVLDDKEEMAVFMKDYCLNCNSKNELMKFLSENEHVLKAAALSYFTMK